MYYLRSKPAVDALQFGIDLTRIREIEAKNQISNQLRIDENAINAEVESTTSDAPVCVFRPKHLRTEEECLMCSS